MRNPGRCRPNWWSPWRSDSAAFPELEDLPPLLKIQQAADAVGMSYPTIRRRIADGTLQAFRVGPREIRVDRDSLIKLASQPISRD